MMMGRTLVLGKKGKAYMIKDSEETIYTIERPDDADDEEGPEPEIVNMNETMDIAGYACTKYEIRAGEAKSVVWVTDKIKPMKPKKKGPSVSLMGMGSGNDKLPGFPLRMENEQGPMKIILTAKEVDTTTPDKALFKLPKGYDVEELDMGAMMGGGGGAGY